MSSIAIIGSSRTNGNTSKLLQCLIHNTDCEVIDLNISIVNHFRYDQNYDDKFQEIIEKIKRADIIILATPVYWYSFSSIMKTFIDRFSDLFLYQDKTQGIIGKKFILLCCGAYPNPPETLVKNFELFCNFWGVSNEGVVYSSEEGVIYDLIIWNHAVRLLLSE